MTTVPKSHPRYHSLMLRERLIDGWKAGIVADAGLIAHGRGEAFDYLIGEKTQPFALEAERAAAAAFLLANRPVISVNGNVAVLSPEGVKELADTTGAVVEANLFYRTEERIKLIIDHLARHGVEAIGDSPDAEIPGLDHARRLCRSDGIYSADTVLVPLEDGDRVQALVNMGKRVICIDLNPLSRSARYAHITVVDNVVRALKNIASEYRTMSHSEAESILANYDNSTVIRLSLRHIAEKFGGGRS